MYITIDTHAHKNIQELSLLHPSAHNSRTKIVVYTAVIARLLRKELSFFLYKT